MAPIATHPRGKFPGQVLPSWVQSWVIVTLVLLPVVAWQAAQPITYFHIDESVWMYLAQRVAAGDLPYRELPWGYLPFAALVPGWWAAIFGASLGSLMALLYSLGWLISLACWGILRILGFSRLVAALATVALVLTSVTSANTQMFSLNLYTPAMLLSSLGGLGLVFGLLAFWRDRQRLWLGLAGLSLALALLSKHELAAGSVAVAIAFSGLHLWHTFRTQGRLGLWDLAVLWLVGLLPTLLVYGVLRVLVDPSQLVAGLKGYGSADADDVLSANLLQFLWTRIAQGWQVRWQEIRAALPWLLIATGLLTWDYRQPLRLRAGRSWRDWFGVCLPALLLLAGTVKWLNQLRGTGILKGLAAQTWIDLAHQFIWSGKWLPFLCLGAVLLPRMGSGTSPRTANRLLPTALMLLAILNLFNYSRTYIEADPLILPNFSVFLPLSTLLWLVVLAWVVDHLPQPNYQRWVSLLTVSCLLALIALPTVGAAGLRPPGVPLKTPHGTVLVPMQVAQVLTDVIAYVQAHSTPSDRLLSCPYANLNYLTNRTSPIGQTFCFGRLGDWNVARQLRQMQDTPPKLVLIGNYPASGFDWAALFRKGCPELWAYIEQHYRPERRLGTDQFWYDVYVPR